VQAGIWTPDSPHAGKILNKKALVHSTATKVVAVAMILLYVNME
jgi:hypothetical protein